LDRAADRLVTQSDEETSEPLIADHRNFYKVEQWTCHGQHVERLLFAGNSLHRARAIFHGSLDGWPWLDGGTRGLDGTRFGSGVGDRTQVWRHGYTGFLLAPYRIDAGTTWVMRASLSRAPAPCQRTGALVRDLPRRRPLGGLLCDVAMPGQKIVVNVQL
jgi:hypothetical protein